MRTWHRALLGALAMAAGTGQGAAAGWREYALADVGGWQQVAYWCDAPGRVLAVTAPARPLVTPQPVTLAQWTGGQRTTQPFQLGPEDAGAGNVYVALAPAGTRPTAAPSGSFVHYSNVENVRDPAYRMTHVSEFRLPAGTFRCRYAPQAAVLAATARHSVTVWEAGGTLTYASHNRDGTPGVTLTGGTHSHQPGGRDRYVWSRAGVRYELEVGNPDTTARLGGTLRVWRAQRLLAAWPLLAYTLSVPR